MLVVTSRSSLSAFFLESYAECPPSPNLRPQQITARHAFSPRPFQEPPSTLLHAHFNVNASIRALDANAKISEHLG
jgi:hypothetical protein